VYTGIDPQVVCLATGSADLMRWEKHPANPVIAGPPAEIAAQTGGHFRDPFVWRAGGGWHMIIGSKSEGRGGLILHYRSDDLRRWEYLGPLLEGDLTRREPVWTGTMWECPNLFELDGGHLLFFSVQATSDDLLYPVYCTGVYDGRQFRPARQEILVHGRTFYAPLALRLDDGRLVMWGWLKEARSPEACLEAGWAGMLSLPLALSLTPEGAVRLEPVAELQGLRREHWRFEDLALVPGRQGWLGSLQGDSLEIEAVFEAEPGAEFGLTLLCSPDGQEQTRLVYDSREQSLVVDLTDSSLSAGAERNKHPAPLGLGAPGKLRLRVYLDRSVVEVFANESTCLVGRAYPSRPDSLGLDLFVRRGSVRLKSMSVWSLGSIWEE
jgi:beta-fructofuranosidase